MSEDSLVAAAGSNGTVVVWNARTALLGLETDKGDSSHGKSKEGSFNAKVDFFQQRFRVGAGERADLHSSSSATALSAGIGQPEAVLAQHTRAVNRLAWHPTGMRPGILLTASQDGTVKLWDRRASQASTSSMRQQQQQQTRPLRPHRSWGFFGPRQPVPFSSNVPGVYGRPSTGGLSGGGSAVVRSWHCAATFRPQSDAVRDIKWSPHLEHVFAAVTDSGCLFVYDVRVPVRPYLRAAVHSGEATTVDWHPKWRYTLATGGGRDRSVKVWDLENSLNINRGSDEQGSENSRLNTLSKGSDQSNGSLDEPIATSRTHPGFPASVGASSSESLGSGASLGPGKRGGASSFRHHKAAGAFNLYTLSISAPVTRLKWRPPVVAVTRPVPASASGLAEAISAPGPNTSMAVGGDTCVTTTAGDAVSLNDGAATSEDRHDAMLAVSTAPVSGASAGGAGSLGLWSCLRPFMPLSVVEGHREGAVADFCWLDTPPPTAVPQQGSGDMAIGEDGADATSKAAVAVVEHLSPKLLNVTSHKHSRGFEGASIPSGANKKDQTDRLSRPRHEVIRPSPSTDIAVALASPPLTDYKKADQNGDGDRIDLSTTTGTWQHVLSVGRDGQCLLQSFARGDRPIVNVPPSTFAIANLSPFQPGYGSLQIMSVHQDVPSGEANDFNLTGLRRDSVTARAPGVFREVPPAGLTSNESAKSLCAPRAFVERVPPKDPELVFSVTDQGELDETGMPVPSQTKTVTVAQEVVHMSRFAEMYCLRCTPDLPTKASLCRHNAMVAENFLCASHAHMWTILSSLLDGAGTEDLGDPAGALSQSTPWNAMASLVLPTVRSLLLERADAGDVQTCVAICEVMQVISAPSATGTHISQARDKTASSSGRTVGRGAPGGATVEAHIRIPGLDLNVVREWYLAYIEILQQMCLFSHATAVIRSCNDPFIGALNQQSTTIHESCPSCRKPLQGVTTIDGDNGNEQRVLTIQRACKSCRKRVGLCFLCHQPVKGMFVWCPGCGHGGHLDHAIEWFSGEGSANGPQEYCPTGCGHKCNMLQHINSFPRTNSLNRNMPKLALCHPISNQ